MVDDAMRKHEQTETASSLKKANALEYLRAKQQGNKSKMSYYSFARKDAAKLCLPKKANKKKTLFELYP